MPAMKRACRSTRATSSGDATTSSGGAVVRGTVASDNIVVHQTDLSAHCLRCGATEAVVLPVQVDVWLGAMAAFGKLHATCSAGEKIAHPCEGTLECSSD